MFNGGPYVAATRVSGALLGLARVADFTACGEPGFSEEEATEISGHETRYVFDRYHIVSSRLLREMAPVLGAFMKTKDEAAVEQQAAAATIN
jgi:hypothetical protein